MAASCSDGVRPSADTSTTPGFDLLLEARHPHHEELGQVRGDDREELQPLEEWIPLVEGFLQDATLEGQQAELPVDV